ncbi:MAG: SurA N-terminal domain-containing protein [Clostridiales bacterium]|nr:SurA N-terminal domain-containing protein [Clostridiales bacterium]
MSALEQIRKRPGLIISILGLALVLFIFTAISNPEQLFSDPSTIAKVNGKKIDFTEFQSRQDEIRRRYENNGMRDIDNAMLQEQAMQSLIEENLLNETLEKVGITVTGAELSEAMLGQNIPMAVQQLYWQRQQAGMYSGRQLYELATNPAQFQLDAETAAQFKQEWMDLEKTVADMLKQQKFETLVLGALQVNELDALAQYNDNNNSTEVRFAKVDASSITDSDIEISDADLREQYEADKELYRLNDDTYVLSYILAEVTPSDNDRLEATQAVEDALMNLRSMPGTDAVNTNNKFVVNRINTAAKYYPANLRDKIESLQQDSVQQISFFDNTYTLAKYLGSEMVKDSLSIDMIALAENAKADSVIEVLNNGTAIDNLPEGTVAQSQLDQRISLLNGNPQLSLIFSNAKAGEYFNATDITGTDNVIFRIAKVDPEVVAYNIAEITYQLDPSTTTINDIQSKLRAYVNNNPNAKAFVENAVAEGYTSMPAMVTKNSLSVAGVPDSRALAKWAVKASKGDVSPVYSDDDKTHFIAATLTNVYDGGYTPLADTQVNAQTRAKVARNKKIQKLMDTYQGKGNSVDSYAAAMNTKVDTTTVTFGQNYARGFMPGDGKLFAIATQGKPGEFKGPAATDYSVVVLEVLNQNTPSREFDEVNDATYFQQTMGAQSLLRNFSQILRANADIDNKVQKFFQE